MEGLNDTGSKADAAEPEGGMRSVVKAMGNATGDRTPLTPLRDARSARGLGSTWQRRRTTSPSACDSHVTSGGDVVSAEHKDDRLRLAG